MNSRGGAAKPPKAGLLKQFSTTVVDQMVLSGANFVIGFLLIRRTSDADYGMFVLVQSTINLLISAQSAWLSSPLAVVAPVKPPDIRRLMIGSLESSQRLFLRLMTLVALVVAIVGYFAKLWTALESLVVALGAVACWTALQREYLRGVLLIYSRPHSMLHADVLYVVVLLCGALLAAFGPKPAAAWAVIALIAAALAGEAAARRSLTADPGFAIGEARPFWQELRPYAVWATVGAMTYWIYNQSYNYVLASRINLTAVADVNATRLLLMPTIVLTVGVKSLLVPTAAAWLAESSIGRLIRRLILFASAIAVLDILYCIVVWVFRNWLTHDLLHKTIADRDFLLVLWAVLSLIALYRDLLQTGLFALRKFRSLAGVTALSAVVSLSIMWVGIKSLGPAAALVGQAAGEGVNLCGVVLLLAVAYRHSQRGETAMSPAKSEPS